MKIRSRIAAVGVSTPVTRYVLATHRGRLIASWTSDALHRVRSRDAESAIIARVQSTRARILAKDGELIVRRGRRRGHRRRDMPRQPNQKSRVLPTLFRQGRPCAFQP